MSSWFQDIRFTLRVLRRSPATTLAIVFTLALGIGANTGMFAGFDAWVLRPLDFERPDELVALEETLPKLGETHGVAVANLLDWRRESRSFEAIEAYRRTSYNFHDDNDPDRVRGARITSTLFPMLGKDPLVGRHFSTQEDIPNGPAVALISHHLWTTRFDAGEEVLGKTIRLDGEPHEVIGVMPPEFEFPDWAHVWTPLALPVSSNDREERVLSTIARLAPGVGAEDAQAEMSLLARRLEELYPESQTGWSIGVGDLRAQWSPPVVQQALWVSVIAAGAVLLVICANVASLLLAQATGRRQEVALRSALGASRRRLIRQMMTEGLVLAAAGAALGIVIGSWWVEWMAGMAPVSPPYIFRFEVDGRALAYTCGVALVAGLVCALAPIVRSSGFDMVESLKGGGRSFAGSSSRLRRGLVIAELAVSVLLVVGALLMVKSFLREQQIDSGYTTEGVLTLRLSLAGSEHEEPRARGVVVDQIVDRLSALPGARVVAAGNRLPVSLGGNVTARVEAEGRPMEAGEVPLAGYHSVTRDYLAALELPMRGGRGFTESEIADGAAVAVVSQSLAARLWPDGEAVGRRIRFVGQDWRRVVGVVGNVDPGHDMVQGNWPLLQAYVPFGSDPSSRVAVLLRTHGEPLSLVPAAREELRKIAPSVPVFDVVTLETAVEKVRWVSSFFSKLFVNYALIALVIAALGVYGVITDSVSRRTREMGLRLALGARPFDLLLKVVGQGALLGALGVALGLLASIPTGRAMSSLLYEVSGTDSAVLAGVALALFAVTLLAAYIPARRAARLDPMEVLRGD